MHNPYELLSKADVIREYNYPREQLEKDIKSRDLPSFNLGISWPTRYYIARKDVEARIDQLTQRKEKK